jgi:hypothetical protein
MPRRRSIRFQDTIRKRTEELDPDERRDYRYGGHLMTGLLLGKGDLMKQFTVLIALVMVLAVGLPVSAAETDPVPPSELGPGTIVVGPDATETYGGADFSWSGAPRERGNVFSVTSPTLITQMEWYINVGGADTFYFCIYRKTNDGTLTGTYTQQLQVPVAISTTGEQWISSGGVSYTLDPAYYYYFSIAWDSASSTYYRGTQSTPHATGFGQLETGIAAGAGHPATWDNTYTTGQFSPYYQRLTFDIVPVELQSLSVE